MRACLRDYSLDFVSDTVEPVEKGDGPTGHKKIVILEEWLECLLKCYYIMEEKIYLAAFVNGRKDEAVRLLKDVKDPREVKGSGRWTLLHSAVAQGWNRTVVVELLVSKYKFDVNCRSVNNWTLLCIYIYVIMYT